MKKLFLSTILMFTMSLSAGMFDCMYSKFTIMARLACTPVRMVAAPFFELELPTVKLLYDLTMLELSQKNRLKMLPALNLASFNEYAARINCEQTTRAKCSAAIINQAVQRDALSLWEKIFTNRQQQLEKATVILAKQFEKVS